MFTLIKLIVFPKNFNKSYPTICQLLCVNIVFRKISALSLFVSSRYLVNVTESVQTEYNVLSIRRDLVQFRLHRKYEVRIEGTNVHVIKSHIHITRVKGKIMRLEIIFSLFCRFQFYLIMFYLALVFGIFGDIQKSVNCYPIFFIQFMRFFFCKNTYRIIQFPIIFTFPIAKFRSSFYYLMQHQKGISGEY